LPPGTLVPNYSLDLAESVCGSRHFLVHIGLSQTLSEDCKETTMEWLEWVGVKTKIKTKEGFTQGQTAE